MKRSILVVAAVAAAALASSACVSGTRQATWTEDPHAVAAPAASAVAAVAAPAKAVASPSAAPQAATASTQGGMAAMPGMAQAAATVPSSATTAAAALPDPDPNAPAYQVYDATAPDVMPGTDHTVTLTIEEKDITIATGYVVHAWTFNGTVPGPVIRVHYGDTVRVHIINPATSTMPHSVDFHASQVAANGPMQSINPGQDAWYIWHADYAGVWMYHCGTTPAIGHMANGMYGMVIVEPRGGLPKVDKEFAIVQSEWYFGGQGKPADIARSMSTDPAPDFVVFNGVANQYKDHPLLVNAGKTVRVFLLDAGPNVWESFHVVGTIFNTVIKEGVELLPGNAGGWGSQAVDLAPAQGAIVQFQPAENGTYTFVTHQFNDVGHGAVGLFQAGDGVYTGASQH